MTRLFAHRDAPGYEFRDYLSREGRKRCSTDDSRSISSKSPVTRYYIREENHVWWSNGRTEDERRMDGRMDGRTDVRAKVRTKRSGLSSCLQPRHSSSVCRPRGGMNAFHYDSYLLPDLSTLSASTPSLLSFSHGGRFDGISSRSRRIRRRSGEERERERETLSSTESTTPALFIPEYREIYRG